MSTGFDAWNTPGWTIQDPVYVEPVDDLEPPTLPMGVTPAQIQGTYMSASGKPYYGAVSFVPTVATVKVVDTHVVLPSVRAEVKNGRLSATIYAVPFDVIWDIREAVGPSRVAYEVILPRNAAGGDITTLEKVTPQTVRPTAENAGQLFTGEGPPPEVIEGAVLNDTYIDILTGDIYTLGA